MIILILRWFEVEYMSSTNSKKQKDGRKCFSANVTQLKFKDVLGVGKEAVEIGHVNQPWSSISAMKTLLMHSKFF